jgi:hypothetical protein
MAVLAAAVGAGAGGAPAASSGITVSLASSPSDGSSVAYSFTVDGQYTYVSYTATIDRPSTDTGNLTHQRLSLPVQCTDSTCAITTDTTFAGSEIVYTSGCPSATYRANGTFTKAGISCGFANGALPPGGRLTVQVVFRVPKDADTDATALNSRAAFLADESVNDQQPQSAHADTFVSGTNHISLTNVATDAVNSYTNPGSATTIGTDPVLSGTNERSTTVDVPAVASGVPVAINEAAASGCPTAVTSTNRACFGQVAAVSVNNGVAFSLGTCADLKTACPNALKVNGAITNIPKFVNLNKFAIFHISDAGVAKIVPLCSSGNTDSTGDCLLQLNVSKTLITFVAQGPSNGSWGSAS